MQDQVDTVAGVAVTVEVRADGAGCFRGASTRGEPQAPVRPTAIAETAVAQRPRSISPMLNARADAQRASIEAWMIHYLYSQHKLLLGIRGNVNKNTLARALLGTTYEEAIKIEW